MLRRGQTTTFQERLDITERAAAGQSDPEIAAALGCSVWTVRKWRRRGQHQGRTGLNSQMGRPSTGPLSTLPVEMRETILHLRRTHPGWGPRPCWRNYELILAGKTSPCQAVPASRRCSRLRN